MFPAGPNLTGHGGIRTKCRAPIIHRGALYPLSVHTHVTAVEKAGWYIFTERFGCYFVELLTSFEKLEQIVPLCCLATAKQLDQL